jgi:molecular chaperone GrpE
MRDTPLARLRNSFGRWRGGRPGAQESYNSNESPIAMGRETAPNQSEEFVEAIQNTDPTSDPLDDVTTGYEGTERTAGLEEVGGSNEETERLRVERDALLDRLARLQAEFENARRRADRERSEFREYAVAGAVEQFLPVLDNFALALKSTGSAEQLRTGVELIVKQMDEVLRNLNVQPVETVGTQFDPRFHEALDQVESSELPDGQVAEEIRRGYRIRERLLRPALVRVVSNPQQKQA